MTSVSEKWTRKQISMLIHAYKTENILYNPKHLAYHKKKLRRESIQRIVAALQSVRPGVNEKDVMTKFHTLRTQFHTENGKRRHCIRSGMGPDDVHVPTLWYFKDLFFLDAFYKPRKNGSTMDLSITKDVLHGNNEVQENGETDRLNTAAIPSPDESLDSFTPVPSPSDSIRSVSPIATPSDWVPTGGEGTAGPPAKRKKKKEDEEIAEALQGVSEALRTPLPVQDDIAAFQVFIGTSLRAVKDPKARIKFMADMSSELWKLRQADV